MRLLFSVWVLLCSCACKEVAWASYEVVKKKELPTGSRCWCCATLASKAYAGMAWSELLAKARSNSDFKQELSAARQRLQGLSRESMTDPEFLMEKLSDRTEVSVTLCRSLLFLPQKTFEKEYGMTPCQAGVPSHEVQDETGSKMAGVLIDDGAPRRVNVEVKQGLLLSKKVASAADMLRPEQSSDLFRFLLTQQDKQQPKHWKSPWTREAVAGAVEESKNKPVPAAPPPERPPLESEDLAGKADEDMAPPLVISKVTPAHGLKWLDKGDKKQKRASKAGAQSRGRGGGRGGAEAGRKRGRGTVETALPTESPTGPPTANMVDGKMELDDGISDSASIGGESLMSQGLLSSSSKRIRGKTPQSGPEKMRSQADKYLSLLDPLPALQGQALGNLRYNGERILQSLRELKEDDTSLYNVVYINLMATWKTFVNCEKLANLKALTPKEREGLFAEVVPTLRTLPADFCVKLLYQIVRELPLTTSTDVSKLLDMTDPIHNTGASLASSLEELLSEQA